MTKYQRPNAVDDTETAAAPPTGAAAPLYQQVREALRARLLSGQVSPGSVAFTEHGVMREFGVSRTTAREAISGLVREGLLYRRRGRGTISVGQKIEVNLGRLTGFTEDVEALGMRPRADVLSMALVTLHGEEASRLELPEGAQAYRIVRLRFADSVPMELETNTFPVEIGLRLAQADLAHAGYYPLLEQIYGIQLRNAEETIECRPATAEEARLLSIRRGQPVIVVRRVTWDSSGRPIEATHNLWRGDRFKYRVSLWRSPSTHRLTSSG